MKFDHILIQVGEFGKYQKWQYLLLCISGMTCAFQTFVQSFTVAQPKARCQLPSNVWPNDTYIVQSEAHRAIIDDYIPRNSFNQYQVCFMYNISSDNESSGLEDLTYKTSNETSKIKCPNKWVYDKSEFIETFTSEFDLMCDRKYWSLFINQVVLIGGAVGCALMGALSDRFGRKRVIVIGVILQNISGFGSALVSDPYLMIGFKFLTGISTSAVYPVAITLIMELVGPSKRHHAGMVINYFYASGLVILAGVAYLFQYWRYLQIAVSIPSILLLTYWWLLIESPRWLLVQERPKEAAEILRKMSRINGKELTPDVLHTIEVPDDPPQHFKNIFKSGLLMRRFANICGQMFVVSLMYYGLSLNAGNLHGNIYLNFFFLGLVEFLGYIAPHILLNRIGRRALHVNAMVLAALACICTIFVAYYGSDHPAAMTGLAITGKCFNSMAFSVIYIWSEELLPTAVRNVGIGIAATLGQTGSVFGPTLNQLTSLIGGPLGQSLPLVIFGSFSLVAAGFSATLPETLNHVMPQTIEECISGVNSRTEVDPTEEDPNMELEFETHGNMQSSRQDLI